MVTLFNCIVHQHDPRLLAVAVVMCFLACLAASALVSRAQASRGRQRLVWTVIAAVEFGGGVWALHFVAMIAFMPGMTIGYDLQDTLLSILIAIAGALAGFAFALQSSDRGVAVLGGMVMLTVAIGGMHYTGAAGMRVHGAIALDPTPVVWSIVISAAFSAGAIRVMADLRTLRQQLNATFMLSAAICALHFTGMSAMTLQMNMDDGALKGVLGSGALAMAVAALSIAMLALSFALSLMDRHLSDRTVREKERLHQLASVSFEGLLIHREGLVLDANERICALSGYDAAGLIGRDLGLLVPGHDAAAAIVPEGDPQDLVLRCRDGREIPVEMLSRAISYDSRAATAVAIRDMSGTRKSEAAMQRLKLISDILGSAQDQRVLMASLMAAAGPERPTGAGGSKAAAGLAPAPTRALLPAAPVPRVPVEQDVGHVQAISLAAFRVAYADSWERIARRAMLMAEQIIRRLLGSDDVFSRVGDDGFAIWFARDDQAVNSALLAKASREIRLLFLQELGAEAATHVSSAIVRTEAARVGVEDRPSASAPAPAPSPQLLDRLQDKRQSDAAVAAAILKELYEVQVPDAQPVIGRDRKITSMVMVDFPAALRRRMLELAVPLSNVDDLATSPDLLRLGLAIQALQGRRGSGRILVPLSWLALTQPGLRKAVDERIAAIDPALRQQLMLTVSGVPPLPSDKIWSQVVGPLRRQIADVGLTVTIAANDRSAAEEAMLGDLPLSLLVIDASDPASAAPDGYFEIIAAARERNIAVLVQPAHMDDFSDWRELGATMFASAR